MHIVDRERLPESEDLRISQLRHQPLYSVSALLQKDWKFHRIVAIEKEGSIPKFVDQVKSISFSARRAIANGQKVLYVTERCVFRLTPKGLKLIEVYPGIDVQKDILDLLPFEVEV